MDLTTTPSPSPPPSPPQTTRSNSPPRIKLTIKLKLTHKRPIDLPKPEPIPKKPKQELPKNPSSPKREKQVSSPEVLPTLRQLCDQDGRLPHHLVLESQTYNCHQLPAHLKRYRCAPCTSKAAGQICAFRHIRQWVCERASPQVILGGPAFPAFNTNPSQLDYRSPEFPTEFNRLPTQKDLSELRQLLARILLPAIQVEMEWWKDRRVKFVGRRIDLVTKCDYCSATLIGSAWLCIQCGAEACVRCFELMNLRAKTTHNRPHSEWLKRLRTCTRLHQAYHGPRAHIKISHITLDELENLHRQMLPLTTEPTPIELVDQITPSDSSPYSVPPELDRFMYRPEGDCSEPYIKVHVDELEADPNLFDRLWSNGQMILVTGMKDRLKIDWTPSFFTRSYPNEPCQKIDSNSQTQTSTPTTVREFFADFEKNPSETDPVWKLRDWPPEVDFQNKFPALFTDFQRAIPIPDVTTRFGIRNVAAHFPQNANVPDMLSPPCHLSL